MESHQLPLIAAAGPRPPGAKGSIGTQSGDGEAQQRLPVSRPGHYAGGGSVQYRAGAMERPIKFEHSRFVGDKRTQLVYDLDEWDDPAPIESLLAAETGICFGPDTLAEARNRGYTLATAGKHRRYRRPRA